ncbi:hypothetical protein G9A89_010310 [Geosiphon pyriformis]|nr:hypothetical protein G9A89_010310 [Geosiphon pyriformis]
MSILGLYTGVSSVVWFFQTNKINSLIAKTVNESTFVILGEDFNKNSSCKCASFKKCLNLGLVNSLLGSLVMRDLIGITSSSASPSPLGDYGLSNVLGSNEFGLVCKQLLNVAADTLFVYMDGSLRNLDSADVKTSMAVFFENVNLDLGCLSLNLKKCYILAEDGVVSENSRHFVHGIFCSIYRACWELGSGSGVLDGSLLSDVDWPSSLSVWHLNLHMAAGFTNKLTASTSLYKGFVFKDWLYKAASVFEDSKVVSQKIVDFVCDFCLAFREKIWLVYAKHHAFMKKNGLIPFNGSILKSVLGLFLLFSAGMIKLLGIDEAFGIELSLICFS